MKLDLPGCVDVEIKLQSFAAAQAGDPASESGPGESAAMRAIPAAMHLRRKKAAFRAAGRRSRRRP
jgi:hypothetical protein